MVEKNTSSPNVFSKFVFFKLMNSRISSKYFQRYKFQRCGSKDDCIL